MTRTERRIAMTRMERRIAMTRTITMTTMSSIRNETPPVGRNTLVVLENKRD